MLLLNIYKHWSIVFKKVYQGYAAVFLCLFAIIYKQRTKMNLKISKSKSSLKIQLIEIFRLLQPFFVVKALKTVRTVDYLKNPKFLEKKFSVVPPSSVLRYILIFIKFIFYKSNFENLSAFKISPDGVYIFSHTARKYAAHLWKF